MAWSTGRAGAGGRDAVAASSGWVLPVVGLFVGGTSYLLARAWAGASPSTAPNSVALVGAALVVAVVEFVVAADFAIHPGRPSDLWRPMLAAGVAAASAGLGLTARGHRLLAALPAAALLLLAARAAETLGKQLAPALFRAGDYTGGEWPAQAPETRRIVLEGWAAGAAAAAAWHVGGALAAAALGCSGLGGLALVVGAKLNSAARIAKSEGYAWTPADQAQAWRGAALPLGVPLLLAALVPGLPRVLSARFLMLPVLAFDWLMRGTAARPERGGSPHQTPPGFAVPVPGLPAPSVGAGTEVPGGIAANAWYWAIRNVWGDVLLLGGLATLVAIAVAYLRFGLDPASGGWRGALRRLWAALLSLFAFLSWLGQAGGGRRLPRPAALSQPTAGDRVQRRGPPAALFDPRLAVRAAYRRYLSAARAAGHPREPAESPARYEERMLPLVASSAQQVSDLTRAYEEARYSAHAPGRAWASRAREAARRLLAALRRT